MHDENILQAVYRIRRADGLYLQHKHGSTSWTSNHLYAGVWTRRRTANHLAHQHEAEVVVCDVIERQESQEITFATHGVTVPDGSAPAPSLLFKSDFGGIFQAPPGTPPKESYEKPCDDFLAKAWDGAGADYCEHCGFHYQEHASHQEAP